MRWLTWTIRLVLLVFLVALAAKNVDPVVVRFYFDVALRAPLIVVLFAAFGLGAFFGVLALLGTLLRQRREIGALRRKAAPPPPPADVPPI
ncbi:MAG TPA: LapA family protein [Burkholderiales bacterium]|nr:LapA family protein [Burkholderiales bacterium]